MSKKIFTLFLGMVCLGPLMAQTESSITADDILYWVGQGDNSAIMVVDFGSEAIAWGYHFDADDEPTVLDMVTAIDAADPRLAYSMDWETYAFNFYYVEYPKKLMLTSYRFKIEDVIADDDAEFSDYDLSDGMVVKISGETSEVWSTSIVAATVATVPTFSTIASDDIVYWVGEGDNEAIVVVYWSSPDTALAWGYRFGEAPTVSEMFAALSEADPRLTVEPNSINFVTDGVTLQFQNVENNYLQFDVEGATWPGWETPLFNGTTVRVGESLFGTGYDSTYYYGWYPSGVVWNTEIHPASDPNTVVIEEATISADDILYWVGEGSNSVVMAVNWADTALAWGYRFDGTATVAQMMDDITAADPRFSYTLDGGYLSDILFVVSEGDTLKGNPLTWWESKNNGVSDAGMAQQLADGDFEKWADPTAGVVVDSMEYDGFWYYIYAYPMTIAPVSVPERVGIDAASQLSVRLYPQPASSMLQVRFDALQHSTEAVMYDMTGRIVYARCLTAGTSEMTVAVAHLNSGIYMLRMGETTMKVVVRR